MKYLFTIISFIALFTFSAQSQSAQDSILRARDSVQKRLDSLRLQDSIQRARLIYSRDSASAVKALLKMRQVTRFLKEHPVYGFSNPPMVYKAESRKQKSPNGLFYFFAGLFLYFALIRLLFDKYFNNLLSLFLRVTMRQQQVREQLLQTPLASLLLNILFVISAGLYLSFLAVYYNVSPYESFWTVFAYCIAFVGIMYTAKFVFLKLIGWIFNIGPATDTYIFIVFMINKIIGVVLLPILVLMAFPHPMLYKFAISISFIILVLLFLYRFFISYRPVRNEIKVNKFHFFIYLCAFEIAPLLLIYKVLLNFVDRST